MSIGTYGVLAVLAVLFVFACRHILHILTRGGCCHGGATCCQGGDSCCCKKRDE